MSFLWDNMHCNAMYVRSRVTLSYQLKILECVNCKLTWWFLFGMSKIYWWDEKYNTNWRQKMSNCKTCLVMQCMWEVVWTKMLTVNVFTVSTISRGSKFQTTIVMKTQCSTKYILHWRRVLHLPQHPSIFHPHPSLHLSLPSHYLLHPSTKTYFSTLSTFPSPSDLRSRRALHHSSPLSPPHPSSLFLAIRLPILWCGFDRNWSLLLDNGCNTNNVGYTKNVEVKEKISHQINLWTMELAVQIPW